MTHTDRKNVEKNCKSRFENTLGQLTGKFLKRTLEKSSANELSN